MARRLAKTRTVWNVPCFVNGQNGQRRVFAHRYGGNATPDQWNTGQSLRSDDAVSWVPWASEYDGRDGRHLAMVQQNKLDGYLPFHIGAAQNPQTCWWLKGTGAPPPDRLRQQTPELMPDLPGMPPVPPGEYEGTLTSAIDSLPPGYVYLDTHLPNAQLFNLDAYAKYRNINKDLNPDLLTDEGTSTG